MKAQVSMEFAVMIAIATAMIVIFMVVFSELYSDNLQTKKSILAQDYGYALQTEFIMAAEAKHGYQREFIIPQDLEGLDYTVSIINNILIINYTENIFSLPIPPVKGNLTKGSNVISKQNETICLNC